MNKLDWFKNNIQRIDIENYNLCNRRCPTCPQSLGLRHKQLEVFDQTLYLKLLSELATCEYSKTLAIGRYHEPLLNFELTLERIKLARIQLPLARIIMNTNGDFLDKTRLKMLSAAGLNEIKIMQYQNGKYSTQRAELLCLQMASRLEKKVIRTNCIDGEVFYLQLEEEKSLIISVRSENYYSSRGNCRGGLLSELISTRRSKPCFVTHKSIDIDYTGDVLPCCNMISDSPFHKSYIIGNIKNETIINLYWKSTHSSFYEAITNGIFNDHEVCQFCSYDF